MSPEQSAEHDVDARSDLFSMGAVLYEMATSQCPFSGKGLVDVLEAIQHRQPVPLEELRPKIPSRVVSIVTKALQKELPCVCQFRHLGRINTFTILA
jgi:serine/threonine protein kinase